MRIKDKLAIFLALFLWCQAIPAQENIMGEVNSWTFGDVYSREKDDEILPVAYKMRVSKHQGYDRIVFEFAEKEVPEYSVGYPRTPLTVDPTQVEDPAHPKPEQLFKIKGKFVVTIGFALNFEGRTLGDKFSGEQHLPVIEEIKGVDWFENYYTFAVGLKSKKLFRVQELSNPARIVVDFKNSDR